MKLDFEPGYIIQNKNPYEDEPPLLIVSFDKYGYLCAIQFNGKWDLLNFSNLFFNPAHRSYYKIGYLNLNIKIHIEKE